MPLSVSRCLSAAATTALAFAAVAFQPQIGASLASLPPLFAPPAPTPLIPFVRADPWQSVDLSAVEHIVLHGHARPPANAGSTAPGPRQFVHDGRSPLTDALFDAAQRLPVGVQEIPAKVLARLSNAKQYAARSGQKIRTWWTQGPAFGPLTAAQARVAAKQPPEPLMRCGVDGNSTVQLDHAEPPRKGWWSTETTLTLRSAFSHRIPTRRSSWPYLAWYGCVGWILVILFGIGWTVLNFPYLLFAKGLCWLGYGLALRWVYNLYLADQWHDMQKLDHAAWLAEFPELYKEFLAIMPKQSDFEKGGKHQSLNAARWSSHQLRCVLRREAIENFMVRRKILEAHGRETRIDVCFHGTRTHLTQSLVSHGILVPGELIPGTAQRVAHTTDTGYFGRGIYVSKHRGTAEGYANSGSVFMCLALRGRVKVQEYKLGCGLAPGYDSHATSCDGEWILFNNSQILPCFVSHPKDTKLVFPQNWQAEQAEAWQETMQLKEPKATWRSAVAVANPAPSRWQALRSKWLAAA